MINRDDNKTRSLLGSDESAGAISQDHKKGLHLARSAWISCQQSNDGFATNRRLFAQFLSDCFDYVKKQSSEYSADPQGARTVHGTACEFIVKGGFRMMGIPDNLIEMQSTLDGFLPKRVDIAIKPGAFKDNRYLLVDAKSNTKTREAEVSGFAAGCRRWFPKHGRETPRVALFTDGANPTDNNGIDPFYEETYDFKASPKNFPDFIAYLEPNLSVPVEMP